MIDLLRGKMLTKIGTYFVFVFFFLAIRILINFSMCNMYPISCYRFDNKNSGGFRGGGHFGGSSGGGGGGFNENRDMNRDNRDFGLNREM